MIVPEDVSTLLSQPYFRDNRIQVSQRWDQLMALMFPVTVRLSWSTFCGGVISPEFLKYMETALCEFTSDLRETRWILRN